MKMVGIYLQLLLLLDFSLKLPRSRITRAILRVRCSVGSTSILFVQDKNQRQAQMSLAKGLQLIIYRYNTGL